MELRTLLNIEKKKSLKYTQALNRRYLENKTVQVFLN